MHQAGEQVTTLGFNRGVYTAGGIVCYAFAIGVPIAAIALSLHVASKNHAELYAVIPIGVIYAAGIALLGTRILRTRVTVTPTILTSYTFQSRPSVVSATKQEIADIQVSEMPAAGVLGGGAVAPYVSLRGGGGFWLRALSQRDRRGSDDELVSALNCIRNVMGLPASEPGLT